MPDMFPLLVAASALDQHAAAPLTCTIIYTTNIIQATPNYDLFTSDRSLEPVAICQVRYLTNTTFFWGTVCHVSMLQQ
jgi:hypothetical protein